MRVDTPKTVDWVTPHEFQGISTEVTEIESSSVRLRACGFNLFLRNELRYIFAPIIMDTYWSPVHELRNNPLPTVAPMSECERRNREVMAWVMVPTIPVPIIAPPNIMAASTR